MQRCTSNFFLAALALALCREAGGAADDASRRGAGDFRPQPQAEHRADRASAEIPLLRAPKMPGFVLVEACINGRKGCFLVDTGATPTVVDERFAKALGLILRPLDLRRMATNVRAAVQAARVETLVVGDDTFRDFDVGVHDLSALGRAMGRPLDGIIGMNILGLAGCRLDFGAGRLALYPAAPTNALAVQLAVPMEAVDGAEWFVWAQVNGRDVRMKIDTGATASFLDRADWAAAMVSNAAPVSVRRDAPLATINTTAADERREAAVRFKLGALSSPDFPMVQGDDNLLGMNFFGRSIVTFHPRNKLVYFESLRAR